MIPSVRTGEMQRKDAAETPVPIDELIA